MTLCGLYNAILILVESLGDVQVHDAFTEACMMIRKTAYDFPMAKFILQGVLALAWSLNVAVPARAVPCFQNLGAGKEELRDIPLAFVLPQTESVRHLLGQEEEAPEGLIEMGMLLSKWSVLSIE